MAIDYVGSQTGNRVGNTSTQSNNYALTGGLGEAVPAAGDLVVICVSVATTDRTPACKINSPGTWLNLGLVSQDGTTYDTSLDVSYKFMGGTPDTAFTTPQSGHVDDGQRWTVHVYRGVDPATPLDVTPVSATGTGTSRPNPPSITPVTAGAAVYVCGGGAAGSIGGMTTPGGGVTAFAQSTIADINDAGGAAGHVLNWTSGAVDVGAFGGTATGDSWVAYSVVLRPAITAAAGGLLVLG